MPRLVYPPRLRFCGTQAQRLGKGCIAVVTETPTNEAVREVWDANAAFWDDRMGEGNLFHRTLVGPAAERLLDIQPGERVLEFGCGNGQFSRRLAELGATVYATELSERMIEHARARTEARSDLAGKVTFGRLDATDPAALAAVPGAPFDAAVCNMLIMDMIEVAPLYRALPYLLTSDGRFVFTFGTECPRLPLRPPTRSPRPRRRLIPALARIQTNGTAPRR
jgi:SAM-dependent methyltransferase